MYICPACQHLGPERDWVCSACGFEPQRDGGVALFAPESVERGFSEATVERLARHEAGSFWFRSRNRLLAWALDEYFPASASVCEVGCGNGFVLQGLAAARPSATLYASDLATAALRHVRRRIPHATVFQADAATLPFVDHFDVAGAFDVLEHIEDDTAALQRLHSILRPDGGGLLLTVPQHQWLWGPPDVAGGHCRRYSAAELVARVEAAGFEVLRCASFVSFLVPLMLASRLYKRAAGRLGLAEVSKGAEVDLPPRLDRLFELIMTAERFVLRRGVAPPVGGSLLLVARRGRAGGAQRP